jgi:hypothetical protein
MVGDKSKFQHINIQYSLSNLYIYSLLGNMEIHFAKTNTPHIQFKMTLKEELSQNRLFTMRYITIIDHIITIRTINYD